MNQGLREGAIRRVTDAVIKSGSNVIMIKTATFPGKLFNREFALTEPSSSYTTWNTPRVTK